MSWMEFGAAVRAYDHSERIYWERHRVLFKRLIEPHIAKGAHVSPKDMIRLPWDGPIERMSIEEVQADIERKMKAWQASQRF